MGKVYQPIPKKSAGSPTRTGANSASREIQDLFPDHDCTQLNLDCIRDLDLGCLPSIRIPAKIF